MHRLGIAWQLSALLVLLLIGDRPVYSDGNVGCLFSDSLCVEDEWCYDDHAFGRCLPAFGSVVEEDLYRYELDRETLHRFEREMERLFALGYRWSHAYTQCELQAMLYASRHGIDFDNTVCSHLVDQDLEGALKSLESVEQVDPQSMAYIRFTPNVDDSPTDFADEVYFPKIAEGIGPNSEIIPLNNAVEGDYVDPFDRVVYPEIVKRTWIPAMHRRSLNQFEFNQDNYDSASQNDLSFLSSQVDHEEDEQAEDNSIPQMLSNGEDNDDENLEEIVEFLPFVEYLNSLKLSQDDLKYLLKPENVGEFRTILQDFFMAYKQAQREKEREDLIQEWIREENLAYLREKLLGEMMKADMSTFRFSRKYNTPERFRLGWESKDARPPVLDNTDSGDLFESRVYIDENEPETFHDEQGSGETAPHHELFRELENQNRHPFHFSEESKQDTSLHFPGFRKKIKQNMATENKAGVFTEGGVVYVPDSQIAGDANPSSEDMFKMNLGKLLDEYDLGFKRRERLDVKKPGPPFDSHTLPASSETRSKSDEDEDEFVDEIVKKEPRGAAGHPNPTDQQYTVDTDYVYIGVRDGIRTWKEGSDIMRSISRMLHFDPGTLTHPRVGRNEVTFRVEPNKQGLNATEVAKKIELIRDRLKDELGVEVISAGVGDKTKMPAILSVENHSIAQMYLMIIILGGILGTILLSVVVLLLIRSQILSRKKLHNLTHPDTEASKDYQDLCRARMATKGQQQPQEKPEGVHGRVTSLSRESEGSQHSPSSRSSTSSWSEEPALTNMDISTGHIVLSYMEDHLKNKDRLEQEWVALCAYEAEPCSTAIALKPENVKKNRYMEILPYDHARVVLNELANMSGSDYINASSITDHDPRNPAYIATQGPLPHTAPDFWQMVWEQGSVVMVMLTRLTENGNAMCHRYWPEEGSEVYHIYEVHLVSEHIWCDDYLVRSFYLKNVKTGETRTVTQFHFLSWPDNSIPTSIKALLEFRRKVNKSYRGRSCPIVVHCSDGAGRTGTYCLIDMVLNRMAKGAKEIDIAATLEHIRDQRPAMVATKQQFEFVLMAVAEEVHAILKALPAQLQQQQEKKDAENKLKEKQ